MSGPVLQSNGYGSRYCGRSHRHTGQPVMNDEGASCERFLEAVLEGQRGRLMTRYIPGDVRRRIVCQDCSDDNNARATFDSGTGRVTLCRNRIRDVAALEDALCHEFVHVYDAVVKEPRLDLSNPDDLACSEIRAAFWGECLRVQDDSQRKHCVHRVAAAAAENNFPGIGARLVRSLFRKCYRDRAPWHDPSLNVTSE
ncbi:Mitochondrial inner membrane protease ATP23 [Plasmodiophora brassicae]|uniref:Mitochondrial inner membrane protease ATP23 n=1 Tax=Plasmodiophora brassicae TaxID=37360 RepID=A0A0G4IUP8_PLABS|nr:hypothetical protein PBRA_007076 [Plasmodiophora brassicae]SPQ95735.1 unnamed protein product [Plasmodiophora brassicae]